KFIALANKEPMVMAGRLMQEEARKRGVRIFPVDSEHSALFQSMEGHRVKDVRRLILTASGGPLWNLTKEQLRDVTVEQALQHPNWKMGDKITIDSATLMNKGLEVVEARWLFDIPASKIEVVVHRESIIHSLVEYADRSVIAQLGLPGSTHRLPRHRRDHPPNHGRAQAGRGLDDRRRAAQRRLGARKSRRDRALARGDRCGEVIAPASVVH